MTVIRRNIQSVTAPRTHDLLGESIIRPEPWTERAVCAETDPDEFFPDKGGSTRTAKRMCRLCPVRDECLAYALEHDERHGIWGGLSERERRALTRLEVAS